MRADMPATTMRATFVMAPSSVPSLGIAQNGRTPTPVEVPSRSGSSSAGAVRWT